ncbi:hypothetical protein, partial [Candidatus Protofrankia datiscae]|uniref:hypothetical protein n=3 Tax=Protofrankia TaxID=2994361 RepID=UPI0013E9E0E0
MAVPDVTQATQRHRRRERRRPIREPRPQLPQHADQALPAQRVDLVEEQHQRPRTHSRPRRERGSEQVRRGCLRPHRRMQFRWQSELGTPADLTEDAELRRAVVVAGGLTQLAGEMQRRVPADGGQLPRQRPQRRLEGS